MVGKYIFLFLFIFIGFISSVNAQDRVNFYTEVNPQSGTIKDSFLFSVVVENANKRVAPDLKGSQDFNVRLIGPSQSTTIINGEISTGLSIRYELTPKHEGQLQTPSAELEIDGKVYTAPPLNVQVSTAPNPVNNSSDQSVLLLQELNKPKVYIGEQVVESLTLLSKLSLYDPKFSDPLFDGFWSEDIGEPTRSNVFKNGQRYTAFKWIKALYPTRSGQIELQARRLEYKSAKKSKNSRFGGIDPFDDPIDSFFGATQYEEHSIDSNSAKIEVKELPPLPTNFKNWKVQNILVGDTKLSLAYQSDPIKTGESKTLQLNIESFGNLQPFSSLPLESTNNYRVYKEKAEDQKLEVLDQLKMRKRISFSIVPLVAGKFHIDPITLGFFDPISETYKEASTQAIDFDVSGSDLRVKEPNDNANVIQKQATPTPQIQAKETIELYQEETKWQKLKKTISISMILFVLALFTLVLVSTIFLLRLRSKGLPLKENVKKINSATDFSELSSLFRNLLASQFNLPEGLAHGESLRAEVKRNISDPVLVFKIQSILDDFDSRLYGINSTPIELQTLKQQALEVTKSLGNN